MKILLVQTSFLGDTILSTPLIAGLKKIYPDAELWMMTTPLAASLVARDPFLTGVIPFAKRGADSGLRGVFKLAANLRKMNFDRVYSLHRSARTALLLWLSRIPLRIGFENARLGFLYSETRIRPESEHDVLRNLALIEKEYEQVNSGVPVPDLRLFAPSLDELKTELSPELFAEIYALSNYVVLFPGSAWETKRWSAAGYHEVVKYLLDQELPVVLLGSPAEIEVGFQVAGDLPVLNLIGRVDLQTTLYLGSRSRLIICNDSMALHLASAFKVPNVAIFCATVPEFGFGPWQNRAVIVQKSGLACRPCARHGGRCCPDQTWACSVDLSAATVIAAVEELLFV